MGTGNMMNNFEAIANVRERFGGEAVDALFETFKQLVDEAISVGERGTRGDHTESGLAVGFLAAVGSHLTTKASQ